MKNTLIVFLASLFIFSCKSDKPQNVVVENKVSYRIPSFQKDSAKAYVEKQLSFGPRVPNTEMHKQCANWLVAKMKSFGLSVREENFEVNRFDGLAINGVNIIGSLNPAAKERIFLCAHWDTRYKADHDPDKENEPILGADDGASGVAVVLEIARILSDLEGFKLGVDFVLFDAEDQGDNDGQVGSWGLGSQYWSTTNRTKYSPQYGILFDMVGAKGARFYKEEYSRQTAPRVVNKIWSLANQMGYETIFVNRNGRGVIDDHYFVNKNAGWPVVDIINISAETPSGFGEHWHTHNDNIDIIDPNIMRTVGRVVVQLLCQEEQNKI